MGRSCVVPNCRSDYRGGKQVSIFKVPADVEILQKWKAAIPTLKLKSSQFICEKHFEEKYIVRKYVKHDANGKVIAEVPFKRSRLSSSAIPTIFGDSTLSRNRRKQTPNPDKPVHGCSDDSKKQNGSNRLMSVASVTKEEIVDFKDEQNVSNENNCSRLETDQATDAGMEAAQVNTASASPQGIIETDPGDKVISKKSSSVGVNNCSRLGTDQATDAGMKAAQVNFAGASDQRILETNPGDKVISKKPSSVGASLSKLMSQSDSKSKLPSVILHERIAQQSHRIEAGTEYSAVVPRSWSVSELSTESRKNVLFSYFRVMKRNGVESPMVQRCVMLSNDKVLSYHIYGRLVNAEESQLPRTLDATEKLPLILIRFENMNVCSGIGPVNVDHLQAGQVFQDHFDIWHCNNCTLISRTKRCNNCIHLRKRQLQRELRCKKNKILRRIQTPTNPVEREKIIAMRKKNSLIRCSKNRAKLRVALLQGSLREQKEEMSKVTTKSLEEKCSELNVEGTQKIALKEIMEASSKKDAKGRRYTDDWIMLCVLMNIRSPSYYEFLRKNNVLPLPCARTIRGYCSRINVKSGFDQPFMQLLKKHFDSKTELQRHGVLLVDEINLRKSIAVCSKNLTYTGLIDFGDVGPKCNDIADQADHGLVIMFQPLADSCTQPIAVFTSKNSDKGEELTKIVLKAAMYLEQSGAKIHGIVAKDASANKTMWSLLGITSTVDNTKTWFTHPLDNDRKIFMFSDTPHLIITIRDRLYTKKRLRVSSESGYIEWKYFESLFDLDTQHVGKTRVCPEITKRHVVLDNTSKMLVRLATQIFSNSVANGLAFYLSQKCDILEGCEETISFCKRMNDMFDALNRKSPDGGLTPASTDFKVLEDSMDWLNRWELALKNGEITENEFLARETAQGLRVSLQSTMDLCCYLTEQYGFSYLSTEKLNQDNLEHFHLLVQHAFFIAAAGCNDHPNFPAFLQL